MSALLLFASTFLSVFALGLQSMNVNQGHYWAAAGTSLLISTGHIFLYRFMPDATLLDAAGYYAGGVAGITASMWFHRSVKAWWQARRVRTAIADFDRRHMRTVSEVRRDEHADIGLCGLHRRDDIH